MNPKWWNVLKSSALWNLKCWCWSNMETKSRRSKCRWSRWAGRLHTHTPTQCWSNNNLQIHSVCCSVVTWCDLSVTDAGQDHVLCTWVESPVSPKPLKSTGNVWRRSSICYMKGTWGLSHGEELRNKWHPLKSSSSMATERATPAESHSPRLCFHNYTHTHFYTPHSQLWPTFYSS